MKLLGCELSLSCFSYPDLHAVHAIETLAYPVPWSLKAFRDSVAVGHKCMALYQQDTLVGYYVAQQIVDEAHLLNICISPEWQRKGMGELLLFEWLVDAKLQQATRACLGVRVSNVAAQNLYAKAGFEVLSRRKDYYRTLTGKEDGIVMAKAI